MHNRQNYGLLGGDGVQCSSLHFSHQRTFHPLPGDGLGCLRARRYRIILVMPIMKAVELRGEIDDQHQLHADVPQSLSPGTVRVLVLISEEDEVGAAWAAGVSSEWAAELSDTTQDIYTLSDGQPVDAAR